MKTERKTKKAIDKEKFDSLLSLTRKYWETGERELITAKIVLCQSLQEDTGVNWSAFLEITDCVLQHGGFKTKANNDTIYSVLRLLGYEVVTDEK